MCVGRVVESEDVVGRVVVSVRGVCWEGGGECEGCVLGGWGE